MSGTSVGATKRDRCATCRQFLPNDGADHQCGKPGPKRRLTDAQRQETATAYQRRWRADHPEAVKVIGKRWRDGLRRRALEAYGGTPPKCHCCGEAVLDFLTVDHLTGGGNRHRQSLGSKGGTSFYAWLRRNGYPIGFRVLCWNCNAATTGGRICPHQLGDQIDDVGVPQVG